MSDPKKVLILGSGGLRIGQAGEFDYSGTQAIKSLKEEGIATILVNPNIATVQTDSCMADTVYLHPLNVDTVTRIIEKERPDGILLGFGGQTALNLGLRLEESGVLERYGVRVLGTPVAAIRTTEDRDLFKKSLAKIGIKTARSVIATTVDEACQAAKEIGYPLMIRSGYSLGGQGSARVANEKELCQRASEALSGAPQLLVEEYLAGWKEIEYEIVRDSADNTITVCNMENLDPMGIHTGESIVVAPSQTLTNEEYHSLREIAIRTARHLGIVGECNIQYALDPKNGDYRVIEVNARLSRSSALASKATGYPLAFVAAKLVLGRKLHLLRNTVTQKTSAFFEPALDYCVVKMPRWDNSKFRAADRRIGPEMKSVGEVMAIGRSFPEALQKAIRMTNQGASGLHDYPHPIEDLEEEIAHATDRRLFALGQYFLKGGTVDEAHKLSLIDPWFLHHIYSTVTMAPQINELEHQSVARAKRWGYADSAIAALVGKSEEEVRAFRLKENIVPWVKQIDTLAGEFEAETHYLYLTYHGAQHDLEASPSAPTLVLGSGPYCIGSSVEFDWCCVNTAKTLRQMGEPTVVINCNPETVSTDYDESDRLYFEELTLERVRDIADFEKSSGVVVSVGGQIANTLAPALHQAGYHLLGTPADAIDQAENRQRFSSLLSSLEIDQPEWEEVTSLDRAHLFAEKVGYPLLVRPSYVLSGAAMRVISDESELERFLREAMELCSDQPVVVSQFITGAKELEIDGVALQGNVIIEAISEHIENAGVHSGDATIVLPPQRLYLETIRRTKKITQQIAKALRITGPFNIQFIAKDNAIKVIECNLRAARSFPFVSKVTGYNFIEIATQAMMGKWNPTRYETLELDYVGVKTPQFSYHRLKGANPVAHVEMTSTGEVACLGDDLLQAFYRSWLATEQSVENKKLLVSVGGGQKGKLLESLRCLEEAGWELYATEGTHDFLTRNGVGSHFIYKVKDGIEPNAQPLIEQREVDLIVSVPKDPSRHGVDTGHLLRRLAIDHHIPLITNMQVAQLFLNCLTELDPSRWAIKSWQEIVRGTPPRFMSPGTTRPTNRECTLV